PYCIRVIHKEGKDAVSCQSMFSAISLDGASSAVVGEKSKGVGTDPDDAPGIDCHGIDLCLGEFDSGEKRGKLLRLQIKNPQTFFCGEEERIDCNPCEC